MIIEAGHESATMCYMESVTHREMRNHSADLLRRVQDGESVLITNHGRPAAVIGPAQSLNLDEILRQGQGRASRQPLASLRAISRRRADRSASELLDDARGRW